MQMVLKFAFSQAALTEDQKSLRFDPDTTGSAKFTDVEKHELIRRVAASAQFRRSLRLRDFLLFVGKTSLNKDSSNIHEQDIGIHVFGRPPHYDRGADGIVRVNATELRKRIDHYFAADGIGESLIFHIPRGGYTPVFSRRIPNPEETEVVSASPNPAAVSLKPEPPESAATSTAGRGWMWLSLVLACLSMLLIGALYRDRRPVIGSLNRPLVMKFWRNFTKDEDADAQVDMVLPDESVSLLEDILRRPVTLPDYVDRSYINNIEASSASPDRKADVQEILRHNLVTFGTVMAARQMLMLPGLAQHFRVTLPRLYPPDLMKHNNLIIVGGKKSNPWAGFFDGQLDFTLEYDIKTSQNFVLNHHPLTGEPTTYQASSNTNLSSGIAVLAFIRNPGNTGDVLLLTGSDSDATAAAADFITSERSFEKLLKRIDRSELPHVEVVLRTTRLNGTSLNSEIVTSRIQP